MASDNTRWVDLKGTVRISKADGNLYIRDMLTNRVTVTQLNRLVDIRTDLGEVFVKLDSGHAALTTLIHGFRFENKAARDKFVDDVMEVLVGNATYVDYPSLPKSITCDISSNKEMSQTQAKVAVQKYLGELAKQWRHSWDDVAAQLVSWNIVDDYAMRPAHMATADRLVELAHVAEDVIIKNTRRPITRPDEVVAAMNVLMSKEPVA